MILKKLFAFEWNAYCSSFPSSRDFASVIRNIGKFGAKNYFTDHRTANTIYGFRDSLPVFKMDDCYWDAQKIRAIARYKVRAVCWCKQPTSNSFETLQTVYNYSNCMIKSIIILLTNVLASICGGISRIRLISWMIYICNVKGLEKVKKLGRNECTLHRWSPVMSDCSRPWK